MDDLRLTGLDFSRLVTYVEIISRFTFLVVSKPVKQDLMRRVFSAMVFSSLRALTKLLPERLKVMSKEKSIETV